MTLTLFTFKPVSNILHIDFIKKKAIFQGLTIHMHNNDIPSLNDFLEIALTWVCNQLSWGPPKFPFSLEQKTAFCYLHLRPSLLMHYFSVLFHY